MKRILILTLALALVHLGLGRIYANSRLDGWPTAGSHLRAPPGARIEASEPTGSFDPEASPAAGEAGLEPLRPGSSPSAVVKSWLDCMADCLDLGWRDALTIVTCCLGGPLACGICGGVYGAVAGLCGSLCLTNADE